MAPAIFQQAIDVAFDVRVIVVGRKVFATAIRIKKQDEGSPISDWRPGQYSNNLDLRSLTYGLISLLFSTFDLISIDDVPGALLPGVRRKLRRLVLAAYHDRLMALTNFTHTV